MNQIEYAKHQGVSQPLVSKWIRRGVIKKGLTRGKNGRADINPKIADAEVKENLNPSWQTKAKSAQKKTPKRKRTAGRADPDPGDAPSDSTGFQNAKATKEYYLAQKHRVEYEKMIGKLIPAELIKAVWLRHVAAAKAAILSIPSEVRPLISEMVENSEIVDFIIGAIDNKIDETLNNLSKATIEGEIKK